MKIMEDVIRLIKAESGRSKVPEWVIHGPGRRADGVRVRHRIWLELAETGYHDADIAAAFGVSDSAIRKARRSRGVP